MIVSAKRHDYVTNEFRVQLVRSGTIAVVADHLIGAKQRLQGPPIQNLSQDLLAVHDETDGYDSALFAQPPENELSSASFLPQRDDALTLGLKRRIFPLPEIKSSAAIGLQFIGGDRHNLHVAGSTWDCHDISNLS